MDGVMLIGRFTSPSVHPREGGDLLESFNQGNSGGGDNVLPCTYRLCF